MRRMVRASAPACLLRFAFERTGLVNRILWIGPALQLSPLHGDDLSRLSQRRRFSEVPDFHRPHYGADRADPDSVALLVRRYPVDFYALPHLESLALQRSELRPVHDVRPAGRSNPFDCRPASLVLRISDFLPALVSQLLDRAFERSFVHLAGNAGTGQLRCSVSSGSGVRGLFHLRVVATCKPGGLAAPVAGGDAFLHAMPVVSPADGVVYSGGVATSAEPLQQRRVCRHALGSIHLDHQLLCPARSGGQGRLAAVRLLRGTGGRRDRALCSWTVAGQPALSS